MKNILKRNQIIILVIALMLVSAGYLSYSENARTNETTQTSTIQIEDETKSAGIGDAKLVNSNDVIEGNMEEVAMVPNENQISNNKEEFLNNEETNNVDVSKEKTKSITGNETENKVENSTESAAISEEAASDTNKEKTKETASKAQSDEYFSESRLNRETMYSQMLESYQKILESDTISETQKSIAQTEIKNINDTRNRIMICENLIKTKGFENLIIFVNDKSISVVIKANELSQEQIAQVQNIIAREMEAEASNIHISNK